MLSPSPAKDLAQWVVGALVASAIIVTAFADGGYGPSAWGFAIPLGIAAIAIILLRQSVSPSPYQLVFACGLSALAIFMLISLVWSADVSTGAEDALLTLSYALTAIGAVAATTRRTATSLRVGAVVGCSVVCLVSVTAHLLPQHFGVHSSLLAPGRLYYPLGYWNAQGVLAALALLLCAGIVANGRSPLARVAAASVTPAVSVNLYLTLSRGAALVVAIGAILWLVMDARRLRASAWMLVCAVPSLVAVWFVNREPGLVGVRYSVDSANAGDRALAIIVACMGATALLATIAILVEQRGITLYVRRGYAGLCALCIVAVFVATVAEVGTPSHAVGRVRDAFTAPASSDQTDPSRVFSLSLNGRSSLWDVAWRDFSAHPLIGSGAGSYEQRWLRERSFPGDSRWAHSLYLQDLAELGALGLLLLVASFLAPILASLRARDDPYVPSLVGAYGGYLAHCAVDWDWQVPTVTITAIFVAGSILASDRSRAPAREAGRIAATNRPDFPRFVAAAAVGGLLIVAILGLIGNRELASAETLAHSGNYQAAVSEATSAAAWQPWSYEPWMTVGRAHQATGNLASAARAYRTATRRDPARWDAWFALAGVTKGQRRAYALAQARRLNPLSSQIAQYCAQHQVSGCPRKVGGGA